MSNDDNHYPPRMIAMLEAVWGEGFLSPGGAEEVARVIGSHCNPLISLAAQHEAVTLSTKNTLALVVECAFV